MSFALKQRVMAQLTTFSKTTMIELLLLLVHLLRLHWGSKFVHGMMGSVVYREEKHKPLIKLQ